MDVKRRSRIQSNGIANSGLATRPELATNVTNSTSSIVESDEELARRLHEQLNGGMKIATRRSSKQEATAVTSHTVISASTKKPQACSVGKDSNANTQTTSTSTAPKQTSQHEATKTEIPTEPRIQTGLEASTAEQASKPAADPLPPKKRNHIPRELQGLLSQLPNAVSFDAQRSLRHPKLMASGGTSSNSGDAKRHCAVEMKHANVIQRLKKEVLVAESAANMHDKGATTYEHAQQAATESKRQLESLQQCPAKNNFATQATDSAQPATADMSTALKGPRAGSSVQTKLCVPAEGTPTSVLDGPPSANSDLTCHVIRNSQRQQHQQQHQPQQHHHQQQQQAAPAATPAPQAQVPQATATFDAKQAPGGPCNSTDAAAAPVTNLSHIKIPKLPMVRFGKKWYRARIVKENAQKVLLEYSGFQGETGPFWLPRDSDRVWTGSYKGKDWKYLGDGAWEPKQSAMKKRGRQGKGGRPHSKSPMADDHSSLGNEPSSSAAQEDMAVDSQQPGITSYAATEVKEEVQHRHPGSSSAPGKLGGLVKQEEDEASQGHEASGDEAALGRVTRNGRRHSEAAAGGTSAPAPAVPAAAVQPDALGVPGKAAQRSGDLLHQDCNAIAGPNPLTALPMRNNRRKGKPHRARLDGESPSPQTSLDTPVPSSRAEPSSADHTKPKPADHIGQVQTGWKGAWKGAWKKAALQAATIKQDTPSTSTQLEAPPHTVPKPSPAQPAADTNSYPTEHAPIVLHKLAASHRPKRDHSDTNHSLPSTSAARTHKSDGGTIVPPTTVQQAMPSSCDGIQELPQRAAKRRVTSNGGWVSQSNGVVMPTALAGLLEAAFPAFEEPEAAVTGGKELVEGAKHQGLPPPAPRTRKSSRTVHSATTSGASNPHHLLPAGSGTLPKAARAPRSPALTKPRVPTLVSGSTTGGVSRASSEEVAGSCSFQGLLDAVGQMQQDSDQPAMQQVGWRAKLEVDMGLRAMGVMVHTAPQSSIPAAPVAPSSVAAMAVCNAPAAQLAARHAADPLLACLPSLDCVQKLLAGRGASLAHVSGVVTVAGGQQPGSVPKSPVPLFM